MAKVVKTNEYDLSNSGIKIKMSHDEIVINGSKQDLMELADYIEMIALSENEKDHLHLDELSLINENSQIKKMIIEKQ